MKKCILLPASMLRQRFLFIQDQASGSSMSRRLRRNASAIRILDQAQE
jgi:hypothetical protein